MRGPGAAISSALHANGNDVTIYHHKQEFIETLSNTKKHPSLPKFIFNNEIKLTSSTDGFFSADYVFIAIPTQSIRSFLNDANFNPNTNIISLSKGIEKETNKLPSEIIHDCTNLDEANICGTIWT